MSTHDHHPIEAIHALVDDGLDASERETVEQHLEACASCRVEHEVAKVTRRIIRTTVADPELPPGLATRIGAALDELDDRPALPARRLWPRLAAVAGALIAVVALVVLWPGDRQDLPVGERIVAAVSADFGDVESGTLPLRLTQADARVLADYFAEQGIDFETRVFDLGMMGYRLAGGRVRELAGRLSALFAYRGADGVLLVCRMYVGTLEELPAPSRTLEHDGITFQVYESDGRTLVFWDEGGVICVLASDAPAQTVIDLSFAKAVKV